MESAFRRKLREKSDVGLVVPRENDDDEQWKLIFLNIDGLHTYLVAIVTYIEVCRKKMRKIYLHAEFAPLSLSLSLSRRYVRFFERGIFAP